MFKTCLIFASDRQYVRQWQFYHNTYWLNISSKYLTLLLPHLLLFMSFL